MNFEIQACNPKTRKPTEIRVEDLAAAIQAVFRLDSEDAILFWNWVPVRISYKYDLSVMIDDLLTLLNDLLSVPGGRRSVYWGSNTFQAEWHLVWADGRVAITAQWESVAGNYEEL